MSSNDWFRGWKEGVFGHRQRKQKNAISRRKRYAFTRQGERLSRTFEPLEERAMLTRTLFVDFGYEFPAGGLLVTDDLSDIVEGPEKFSVANLISLETSVANQGINFDGIGGVGDQADAIAFGSAVITALGRIFEPFDVDIRLAESANFDQIANTLFPGEDGDAYIVAAGSSLVGVDPPPNGGQVWGWAPVDDGNDDDNTGFVFVDTILSNGGPIQALVNTTAGVIAHEAGHTFGLEHTDDNVPQTVSDVMRTTTNVSGMVPLFSRMALPLEDPPVIGSSQQNAFAILADPDVLDLRSQRAYVTGSGRPDAISITATGPNTAQVTIADVQTGTQYATYPINTSAGITIEAGSGNDRIVIDDALNTPIEIRGGLGSDTLIVADGNTTVVTEYDIRRDQVASNTGHVIGYDPNELEIVEIYANADSSYFDIHSFAALHTLNIYADQGSSGDPVTGINFVRMAPQSAERDLSAVQGTINYESRNFQDRVELFDQNASGDFDYSISSDSINSPRSLVIERESAGRYSFSSVDIVTIRSGDGNSDFNVHSVASPARVDIYAGAGNDRLLLSPDDHRAGEMIFDDFPPFMFFGEGGSDQIEVFDEVSFTEGTFRYTSTIG